MEFLTFIMGMNIFAEMSSGDVLVCVITGIIALVVGLTIAFPLGVAYRRRVAEAELGSAEEEARRIVNESIKTAESRKKKHLLKQKTRSIVSVPKRTVRSRTAAPRYSVRSTAISKKKNPLKRKPIALIKKRRLFRKRSRPLRKDLPKPSRSRKASLKCLKGSPVTARSRQKLSFLTKLKQSSLMTKLSA